MPRLTRMTAATTNLQGGNLKSSTAILPTSKGITLRSSTTQASVFSKHENLNPVGASLNVPAISKKMVVKSVVSALESNSNKRSGLGDITNVLPSSKTSAVNNVNGGKSNVPDAKRMKVSNTNVESTKQDLNQLNNKKKDGGVVEKVKEATHEDTSEGGGRKIRPSDVIDFDAMHANDPCQEPNYAMQIFEYYKQREPMFCVSDYLALLSGKSAAGTPSSMQPEITHSMRAILVDWLVEVQESFELNHETLYTAVRLVDLYLSRKGSLAKSDLQLIGVSAFLIASKVDERIPPLVDDFVYVCDDAYSKERILSTEIEMLCVVDFDLGYPLSYRFLRRYARVCQISTQNLTFCRYILEMSLMEYSMNVQVSESMLAASVLILVLEIRRNAAPLLKSGGGGGSVSEGWRQTLQYYSGYVYDDCKEMVLKLHSMILKQAASSRKTIKSKYSHPVFHSVAKISIPETLHLEQLQ